MPPNPALCLDLATRIDALLLQAIGIGVDPARLMEDRRYERDVLLVCDALDDPVGPQLARDWRAALDPVAESGPKAAGRAQRSDVRTDTRKDLPDPKRSDKRRNGPRDRRLGRGKGSAPGRRERRRALRREADSLGARSPGKRGETHSPDTFLMSERLEDAGTPLASDVHGKNPSNGTAKETDAETRADSDPTAADSRARSAPSALKRWFSRRSAPSDS